MGFQMSNEKNWGTVYNVTNLRIWNLDVYLEFVVVRLPSSSLVAPSFLSSGSWFEFWICWWERKGWKAWSCCPPEVEDLLRYLSPIYFFTCICGPAHVIKMGVDVSVWHVGPRFSYDSFSAWMTCGTVDGMIGSISLSQFFFCGVPVIFVVIHWSREPSSSSLLASSYVCAPHLRSVFRNLSSGMLPNPIYHLISFFDCWM
jgi:hypothetical protein